MNNNLPNLEFSEAQGAIYGVALSLDAFVLNGIQYGVLQNPQSKGFSAKAAGNLLRDLAVLETHSRDAPVGDQGKVTKILAMLRTKCLGLIDLVTELGSFRSLRLQQVRSAARQISAVRGEFVQLIQRLEGYFQTSRPFYQSRPAQSTAAMNDFLSDLERMVEQEWHASQAEKDTGSSPSPR